MQVRPAAFDDWTQLSQLIEDSNAEMRELYDVPDYTRIHLTLVYEAIRSCGGVFVAEDVDRLVGYVAWISLPEFPKGVVEGLGTFVVPSKRKLGVSRLLREAAIGFHEQHGGERVYGVVHTGNEAGLQASLAEGFEIVGQLVRKRLK